MHRHSCTRCVLLTSYLLLIVITYSHGKVRETIDRSAVARSAPRAPKGRGAPQTALGAGFFKRKIHQVRQMFIAPRPPHAVVALRSSGRSKSRRSKNRWAGRFSHMRALRPPRRELLDWSKSSSKRKRSLKGLLAPSVWFLLPGSVRRSFPSGQTQRRSTSTTTSSFRQGWRPSNWHSYARSKAAACGL